MPSKSSGKAKPSGSQPNQPASRPRAMPTFPAELDAATSELTTVLSEYAQRIGGVFHGASCSVENLPSLAHAAVDILSQSERLLQPDARGWIHDSKSRQEFIATAHALLLRHSQQLAAAILTTTQAIQRINVLEEQMGTQASLIQLQESRLEAQGRQIDAFNAQLRLLLAAREPSSPPGRPYASADDTPAASDLGSSIDSPSSSPAERIRADLRASAAIAPGEKDARLASQDSDSFTAPISPVVDDPNDSDYDDEVVVVENPNTKKLWVYEDDSLAEVHRHRQAVKDGLCDHRYPGPDDLHCSQPREKCVERQLGNHVDQCRWITTKHAARCRSSIKQCPQHRQWAPQPPLGKLYRRESSLRPRGVDAQEFFFCEYQSFKKEALGSEKKNHASSSDDQLTSSWEGVLAEPLVVMA